MTNHLRANPNFYDYIHRISLEADNTCEFIDGAGQCICLEKNGTYTLTYDNETNTSGSIEFKVKDKHFKVNFRVQTGLFVLMNEIVWNSTLGNWPFTIATKRYIFDVDPFDGLYQNRENNLYFILEGNKETDESKKCFFSNNDTIEKNAADLNTEELEKVKTNEPDFYTEFIKNPKMKSREFGKILDEKYNKENDN